MQQFHLDFETGLTARFPRWEDTLVHAVYSSRLGLNGVAAKLDMSPSELSKRLSHHTEEPRPIRSQDIIGIIEATGDYTPVYWLIERFLGDPEAKQRYAIEQLPHAITALQNLIETAGAKVTKLKRA